MDCYSSTLDSQMHGLDDCMQRSEGYMQNHNSEYEAQGEQQCAEGNYEENPRMDGHNRSPNQLYAEMLSPDSELEQLIGDGTIIDAEDEEPITDSTSQLDNAGWLKRLYEKYKNSRLGRAYHQYLKSELGAEPEIDAYGVVEGLPESALAAIIKTNHPKYKNILALSGKYLREFKSKGEQYWEQFKDMLNDYVFLHEDTHAAGELSEKRTEGRLKRFYNRMKEYVSDLKEKMKYSHYERVAAEREAIQPA